eukprot:PhM_4_TR18695/c2_g1_i1/m.98675
MPGGSSSSSTVHQLITQALQAERKGAVMEGFRLRHEALNLSDFDPPATMFEDFIKRSNIAALDLMNKKDFDASFELLSSCEAVCRSEAAGTTLREDALSKLYSATLNNVGLFYQMRSETEAAIASFHAALDVREDASTQLSLSNVHFSLGELDAAVRHSARALELAENETREVDESATSMSVLVRCLQSHGLHLERQNKFLAAMELYLRAYHVLSSSADSKGVKDARAASDRCADRARRQGHTVVALPRPPTTVSLVPNAPSAQSRAGGRQSSFRKSSIVTPAGPVPPSKATRPKTAAAPTSRPSTAGKPTAGTMYAPRPPTAASKTSSSQPKPARGIPDWTYSQLSKSGQEAYNHFMSCTPREAPLPPRPTTGPWLDDDPRESAFSVVSTARTPLTSSQRNNFSVAALESVNLQMGSSIRSPRLGAQRHITPRTPATERALVEQQRQRRQVQSVTTIAAFLRALSSLLVTDENARFHVERRREVNRMLEAVRESERQAHAAALAKSLEEMRRPLQSQVESLEEESARTRERMANLEQQLTVSNAQMAEHRAFEEKHEQFIHEAENLYRKISDISSAVKSWEQESVCHARERHQQNVRCRDAAVLIQRYMRRWRAARHRRELEAELRRTRIETFLANFRQQTKLRVERMIKRRCLRWVQDARDRLEHRRILDINGKVLMLQGILRSLSSGKLRQNKSDSRFMTALTRVQSWFHGYSTRVLASKLRVQWLRERALRETSATLSIQCMWRGYRTRRTVNVRRQHRSAELWCAKKEYAARRLGAWWRSTVGRRTYLVRIAAHREETRRREAEEDRVRHEAEVLMNAVGVIYRTYVSYLARRRRGMLEQLRLERCVAYHEKEMVVYAAHVLQRFQRTVVAVARVKREREYRDELAALREWHSQQEERERRDAEDLRFLSLQARKVQKIWRGYAVRLAIVRHRHNQVLRFMQYENDCAIKIQRTWLRKTRLDKQERGDGEMTSIEAISRDNTRSPLHTVCDAVTVSESSIPQHDEDTANASFTSQAVSSASERLVCLVARLHIGCVARAKLRWLAARSELEALRTSWEAEHQNRLCAILSEQDSERVTIVCAAQDSFDALLMERFRDIVRRHEEVRQREHRETVARALLQRIVIGYNTRVCLSFERSRSMALADERRTDAITAIQTFARTLRSLSCVRHRAGTMHAVATIQRIFRGWRTRAGVVPVPPRDLSVMKQFERYTVAAIDIQSVWRRALARNAVARKRKERLAPPPKPKKKVALCAADAAEVVQRAWRSYLACKCTQRRHRLLEVALVLSPMQALCRAVCSQMVVRDRPRADKHHAASKIQGLGR